MEKITKKIIEYKTNYRFRDLKIEEQLAKELQEALIADFYNRLFNVYAIILWIIKWLIIANTLNYLIKKFCKIFTKQECWGIRIFCYIFVTPPITGILIESLDLYKEKYW